MKLSTLFCLLPFWIVGMALAYPSPDISLAADGNDAVQLLPREDGYKFRECLSFKLATKVANRNAEFSDDFAT